MIEDIQNPNPDETSAEPENPPARRAGYSLSLVIVLVVIFFGAGLLTGYLAWGQPLAQSSQALEDALSRAEAAEAVLQQAGMGSPGEPQPTRDPDAPIEVVRYPVDEANNPSFGPADAPITIIEFSDYECPFCTRWHAEVWPKLLETYGEKIRLVYRDFPLSSIHPNASEAAEAANCANEQGKFWEYHDLLFQASQGLGREAYEAYASQLDLDLDGFKACLDEKRYADEVTADYEFARQLGVQSTPTFFINGVALIGAQPFEVFQEVIDLELAGKLTE
ncbi:MAG: thioredoxin domain-containing protein [Bellilinea sp.]|jgi:protein-disulfide isomerase